MLTCQDLTFKYEDSSQFIFPDIQCNDLETTLIIGNSGKGKTTLLHLLALLLKPLSGTIEINGQAIERLSSAEAAKFRAKNIGIIYQKPHFVEALTVEENLLLANYLSKTPLDKEKVKQLAKALDFEAQLSKKTKQLSLGEQQRVGIARALMNNPKLVLADEPTSSLDDVNCQKVIELLDSQVKTIEASLVIVTHDQRLKSIYNNHISL